MLLCFFLFSFTFSSLSHFDLSPQKFLSESFSMSTKGWKQTAHYDLDEQGLLGEYFVSEKNMIGSLTIRKVVSKPLFLSILKQDFIHSGFKVNRARKLRKGIFVFELYHKLTRKHMIQLSFVKEDHLIVLTCKSHQDYFEKIKPLCFRTLRSFQWIL